MAGRDNACVSNRTAIAIAVALIMVAFAAGPAIPRPPS
jgi:hypothetical protein